MNFELSYIIAPLLGGVIGYITNDIAIRMLFRPHTEKYIWRIHVPLTPGIIPKEKNRIAEAIGGVISANLMNKDVLTKYLLSDEMIQKVRGSVENFFIEQQNNNESVQEFLCHYLRQDEIQSAKEEITTNLTNQIATRLQDSSLGDRIAHIAVEHVLNDMKTNGIAGIAMMIIRPFLSLLQEPAERMLSQNINDIIHANGKDMVSILIQEETQSILSKSMKEMLSGHNDQIIKVVNTIESLYRNIIEEHLPKILDSINIAKIVCERIKEMDVNETEKLILQVMDKELKAIVWFGAGLGMIMGSINCFLF